MESIKYYQAPTVEEEIFFGEDGFAASLEGGSNNGEIGSDNLDF